jgi:hypothetical protein
MEEVEESGLLPEHEPLSDIDYVTDDDHWPTALAVEVGVVIACGITFSTTKKAKSN